MPTTMTNRRAHARYAAHVECKLRRQAMPKYESALTGDVSAGGALLDIRTSRPVRVGEQIEIAMNWADRPLLGSGDLVRARVVRVEPALDRHQRVAIEFDKPQEQADRLAPADAA